MSAAKPKSIRKARPRSSAGGTTHRDDSPRVVLVLQGGGALGAYHIGVYQALHEAGLEPDWIAGVSIGAFNACVIAGNAPDERVARLAAMWEAISRPENVDFWMSVHGTGRRLHNVARHVETLMLGQPNFFYPRFPGPQWRDSMPPEDVSYYVSSPMLDTLKTFSDFDRINSGHTRLSVGATHVRTGTLIFFDNAKQSLRPEHVLASGSLPPGLPGTRIDGELFWDGGCVSNTPLDAVFQEPIERHTIVFMIDLWSSLGKEPRNLDELKWRQNDILYASRSTHRLLALSARRNLQHALSRLNARDPESEVAVASVPSESVIRPDFAAGRLDIVHITYRHDRDEIPDAGEEFSRTSIEVRRGEGYRDTRKCLHAQPWATSGRPPLAAASIHHYQDGKITSVHPF